MDRPAEVVDQERPVELGVVLVDPEGDNLWHLAGEADLSESQVAEGPLARLRSIGT